MKEGVGTLLGFLNKCTDVYLQKTTRYTDILSLEKACLADSSCSLMMFVCPDVFDLFGTKCVPWVQTDELIMHKRKGHVERHGERQHCRFTGVQGSLPSALLCRR